MLELADKNIKIVIIVFHLFKKLEEWLNMLSRNMDSIFKTQIEIVEKKITMFEIKNTLDRINGS